jgi:tetratricopeptide (TPR) repeat protein
MRRWTALAAALLAPAIAHGEPELLRQARNNFEFGKYEQAARLVEELLEKKQLSDGGELVEAFRIHGLSHFYLGRRSEARRSFVKALSANPDLELDPLLVPPSAIEEFEAVKRENETTLAELRLRRRAAAEEKRLENEARRKLLEGDELRRREPIEVRSMQIIERVEKHNLLSTLLPFGVAQFEQGRNTSGALFATIQGVTLFASVLSYAQVQDRIESTGKVKKENLAIAQRWRAANWVSFGLAALTYVGGVTEAAFHFREERSLPVIPRETPAPVKPAPPARAGATLFLAPAPGCLTAGVSGTF